MCARHGSFGFDIHAKGYWVVYLAKHTARRFVRALQIRVGRRRLPELRQQNALCGKLADVLEGAFAAAATPDEQKWITSIEAIRRSLARCREKIYLEDFGARSADSTLTEGDMRKGAKIVKEVRFQNRASKEKFWALLLFRLIREFQPNTCLELGTCLGISAAYHGAALKLNKAGKLVTLEGSESLAEYSRSNLAELGLDNVEVVCGRFVDTLPDVLNTHAPIDYAFVDGHHAEQPTIDYFNMIAEHASEFSLFVFDDISWSDGMRSAWRQIADDPRVKVALDLRTIGICVLHNETADKTHFRIPLY